MLLGLNLSNQPDGTELGRSVSNGSWLWPNIVPANGRPNRSASAAHDYVRPNVAPRMSWPKGLTRMGSVGLRLVQSGLAHSTTLSFGYDNHSPHCVSGSARRLRFDSRSRFTKILGPVHTPPQNSVGAQMYYQSTNGDAVNSTNRHGWFHIMVAAMKGL
ncbi:hypothetical protein E3N88_08177 [Mikania micrantha]|uniref:Uncharacterized protein n=1 Tax=Mikania micrantha TaxID=192012 RepID=A0A5N6PG28_9ASTR|nr:hypothetical protein E3N88_08177 [Mikania micrantha]